jgi:hypothetical protein
LQHVPPDVILKLHLQDHVIAKLKQLQDVEVHQQVDLPDVEITVLLIVIEDVLVNHQIHLNHHNAIAKLNLLQDVELD